MTLLARCSLTNLNLHIVMIIWNLWNSLHLKLLLWKLHFSIFSLQIQAQCNKCYICKPMVQCIFIQSQFTPLQPISFNCTTAKCNNNQLTAMQNPVHALKNWEITSMQKFKINFYKSISKLLRKCEVKVSFWLKNIVIDNYNTFAKTSIMSNFSYSIVELGLFLGIWIFPEMLH